MPTLDQSFTTSPDDSFSLRIDTSTYRAGQQFTPATGGQVTQVDLNVFKSGSPTGNVWVEIWSDNGSNLPNAKIGVASANVDVSTLTTNTVGAYQSFTWTVGPNITAGTKYWIVLSGDFTQSGTNFAHWTMKDAGGYAGGVAAQASSTDSWSSISTKDFNFKEYWDVAPVTAGGFFLTFN